MRMVYYISYIPNVGRVIKKVSFVEEDQNYIWGRDTDFPKNNHLQRFSKKSHTFFNSFQEAVTNLFRNQSKVIRDIHQKLKEANKEMQRILHLKE